MHQLPPEPAYFRVRVRRRLAAIGALPVRNAVYALPCGPDAREDLEWLVREIAEDGGEAILCKAFFIDGATDARLRAAFDAERNAAYSEIVEAAARLRARLEDGEELEAAARRVIGGELAALERRLEETRAMDTFQATGRAEAERALAGLARAVRRESREGTAMDEDRMHERPQGRTWVTRRGARIDRIASAWLIRRFIDPEARFEFVDPDGYDPAVGELRFDMFGGEFTHEGDRCTFETLLDRFALAADPALVAIGEIVHDLDLKEERYGRPEAAGLASFVRGITISHADDRERIEAGRAALDPLYAYFGESV